MKLVIFWTTAFIAMATLAYAALPQTISYQGFVKDNTGTPVNNNAVTMKFALYSSTRQGSDAVWSETQNVNVSNGIFSVQLGAASPNQAISAPFDVPYWLGVNINGSELPLQPFSSTGYAFRAGIAENVPANSISSINISGTLAADKLDLSNVVKKSGDTMTGNLNFGSATRQMLTLLGTGYGLGVQADTLYSRSWSNFAWFKNGVHSDTQGDAGTGGTPLMFLNGSGNLGIGTITPTHTLDVVGDAKISGTLTAGILSVGSVLGNLDFGLTTRQMLSLLGTGYGIGVQANTLYNRSWSNFAWFKHGEHSDTQGDPGFNGTALMFLDGSGKLGIGTTTPTTPLEVVGDAKISGKLTTGSLSNASVTTAALAPGAVTTTTIADNNVTTTKLASGAVTTATIADNNVTAAKLASGAVTTATIVDSSVTAAKLAASAVTMAKLAPGAVTAAAITVPLTLNTVNDSTATLSATNNGNFAGVQGVSTGSAGVYGHSLTNHGVYGFTDSAAGYGVYGLNTASGSFGYLGGGHAVYGQASGSNLAGVYGYHPGTGFGIFGKAPASGWAGWFDGWVNVTQTLTQSSDLRLKTDILPLENTLTKVMNLRGVSYVMKADEAKERKIGVIAQELEQEYPELVLTDSQGGKSVAYANLSAVLIEAVKAAKAEKDAEISALRTENNSLKIRLEKIELLLNAK